jgi:hypothetical protein
MNTEYKENKDIFHNLFKSDGIREPGPGFTNSVMSRITELDNAAVVEEPDKQTFFIWLISGLGIIVAIAAIIFLSLNGYIQIVPDNFDFLLLPVFKKVILNFREIFATFQLSSITVAILLALAVIVIFERLLKKISLNKNAYLISL